jgi:hypothetical protein
MRYFETILNYLRLLRGVIRVGHEQSNVHV